MNQSTLIVLSTLMMAYTDTALSELKKYRDWPSAVRVPTPEIKRQYEYDPQAGAVSDKLLGTTYSVMYGPKVVYSSHINYKNSVAVSGAKDWNVAISVYHGFAIISSFDLATTKKILFQSNGAWPASALKIYSESVDTKGDITKVGLGCRQIKSFPASNIFHNLPGRLYRYECSNSTGIMSGDFTWAPGEKVYITYYSDYLDTPIFSDVNLDPPVIDGVPQTSTATYSFLDQSGVQQKISLQDPEMRSIFFQQ